MTTEDRCTQLEAILADVLDCFDDTEVETADGGIAEVGEDTAVVLDRARDILFREEEEEG